MKFTIIVVCATCGQSGTFFNELKMLTHEACRERQICWDKEETFHTNCTLYFYCSRFCDKNLTLAITQFNKTLIWLNVVIKA